VRSCTVAPPDKKLYGKQVGEVLVRNYGKKRYYPAVEVKKASLGAGYPLDYSCWGLALFTSPEDFAAYHEAIGQACDYAAMKGDMLAALGDGAAVATITLDFSESWLDLLGDALPSLFDLFD